MRKTWTLQERNSIIHNWAEYNNVALLPETAEFTGNKSPIYYRWLDGDFKELVGKTNFDSILAGSSPTINGLTNESKQLRAKKRFLEYGLDLLEDYRSFSASYSVKILDGNYAGYYGETSLATVNQKRSRGKNPQLTISILTDSEKKRYFTEYAKSRGYTIIDYPEKLAVRGTCKLLSPQGNEWETVWYHFAYQENCNCPQDFKRSLGERMVNSVLTANGIKFIEQHKIVIGDKALFFDFYLPEHNLVIEYNGKQHYEDVGGYYKGKLTEFQQRDRLKQQWCAEQGIAFISLSYKLRTVADIATELTKTLPITVTDTPVVYSNRLPVKDILAFYGSHTGNETSEQFGITKRQLGTICQQAGFSKKKQKKV